MLSVHRGVDGGSWRCGRCSASSSRWCSCRGGTSAATPAKLVMLWVKLMLGIVQGVREADGEADGVLKSNGGVLLI